MGMSEELFARVTAALIALQEYRDFEEVCLKQALDDIDDLIDDFSAWRETDES